MLSAYRRGFPATSGMLPQPKALQPWELHSRALQWTSQQQSLVESLYWQPDLGGKQDQGKSIYAVYACKSNVAQRQTISAARLRWQTAGRHWITLSAVEYRHDRGS